MSEGKGPVKKFNAGAISAAIWENRIQTSNGTAKAYSVKVEKSYKDKNSGQWKSTAGLGVNDIPKAIHLLVKCYNHLIMPEIEETKIVEELVK